MIKTWLVLGGLNMALAVSLGAFGAHALKTRLTPEMLEIWQTGVTYHVYHALGLIGLGLAAAMLGDSPLFRISGSCMTGGIFLFSGSLYLLCLTGIGKLGMITPVGGMAFIAAWVLFAVGTLRSSL